MLSLAAQVVGCLLLVLVVVQGLMLAWYVRVLLARPPRDDRAAPRCLAILCVRGCDPDLEKTVRGLLRQDYPDYAVTIVVDHLDDPAWPVIEEVVRQEAFSAVRMAPLTERTATCSRKIAGVLQAVRDLDESFEVAALLDSDTIPHAAWLADLVRPLGDPAVGASTGNRWYAPPAANWGSLVRYLWNAAAVVQMYWYRQPWGGSMALRADLLREGPLTDELAVAFGEDSTICASLARRGLRVVFTPEVLMVNRETCSLPQFFRFLCRQMVIVRLHNPAWPIILGHGWGVAAAQGAALALALGGLLVGDGAATAWAAAGFAGYWAAMFLLLALLEWSVRRVVGRRGQRLPRWSVFFALRVAAASLLTQVVYAWGLWRALRLRQHCWRGVTYRFGGGTTVRVIHDDPYHRHAQPQSQPGASHPTSI